MGSDRLCIAITVFERQHHLDAQMDFLGKTLDPSCGADIVVFDDGSRIPITLPETHLNARLLRSEQNIGLIAARNQVFAHVMDDYDYVMVLDDDIRLFNIDDAIRLGIETLKAGHGIVSFPYIDLPVVPGAAVAQFRRLLPSTSRSSGCFFAGCSIMPTRILRDIGLLEGIYRFSLEEEDYSLRLYAAGIPTTMLYGTKVLAIHDHAPGKDHAERAALRLSNRYLYHHKFIRFAALRGALNLVYAALYCLKRRNVAVLRAASERYAALESAIVVQHLPATTVLGFLLRRYVV